MIPYNPDWGNYRTRKFKQIFPTTAIFTEELLRAEFPYIEELQPQHIRALYSLLYARYGNSSIASDDENQFKYGLWSIIFMYGPTWVRRLELQQELRHLSPEEYMAGSRAIYNTAVNPGSAPNTSTLKELPYINQQNTTNYSKSRIEGLSTLNSLLETDVTKEFIDKFKHLFITIVQPDYPLYYVTTPEEQEIIDN